MATLQDRIELSDGVTPALNRMIRAADMAAARFEMAGQAAARINRAADFVAAIEDMRHISSTANLAVASINEIAVNANMMTAPIHSAVESAEDLNNRFRETSGILGGIRSALSSTFGQFTLANLAANGIMKLTSAIVNTPAKLAGLGDEYSGIKARIGLVTANQQEAVELNNQIYYSALRARRSYAAMADAVSKIAMSAKEAFPDAKTVVPFMENVQKLFTIGGTDIVRQKDALLQLTQALGSGKLQGDEFRSIAEAAPLIESMVARYMGVSQGALKELSKDGQITAEIMKNSILSATDEINAQFDKIPIKWQDIAQYIKTETYHAFVPVFEKISELANTPWVNELANDVVSGMKFIAQGTLSAVNMVQRLGAIVSDNSDIIIPAVWGVVAALTVANGELLISGARSAWAAAMAGVHALSYAGLAVSAVAACVAQNGLNVALAACPITWIIYGVIALIGVFYLAVAAVNRFAGTSISATGIIAGCFGVAFAFIHNKLVFIWNCFAAFIEFFINSGKNAAYASKKLVANLAINFIDACIAMTKGWDGFATSMANAIIQAVNIAVRAWNNFVSILPDKIKTKLEIGSGGAETNMIGRITSVTGAMENAKAMIKTAVGPMPEDYIETTKKPYKNLAEAWNKTYNWGSNLGEGVFSIKGDDKIGSLPIGDIPAFDDMAKSGKDTAGNTKAIKDAMDITDEDIKYLRDIAEREAINKFTTAEIKLDMTNYNNVENEIDLDGMTMHLNDQILEGILSGAEAVHK